MNPCGGQTPKYSCRSNSQHSKRMYSALPNRRSSRITDKNKAVAKAEADAARIVYETAWANFQVSSSEVQVGMADRKANKNDWSTYLAILGKYRATENTAITARADYEAAFKKFLYTV